MNYTEHKRVVNKKMIEASREMIIQFITLQKLSLKVILDDTHYEFCCIKYNMNKYNRTNYIWS